MVGCLKRCVPLCRRHRGPMVAVRRPQEGPGQRHHDGVREGGGRRQRQSPADLRHHLHRLHGTYPQGSPAPGRTAPSGEIERWRYIGVGMSYPAVSASVSVPAPHPSPHATAAQMLKAWVTRCLSKNRILGWVYRPRPHKADFMAKPQRSCTVRPSVYTKPANPLTETVNF